MDSPFQFTKLCHIESGRLFLVLGILAIIHILCQSLMLPYKSFLLSLMADGQIRIHGGSNIVPTSSSEVPVTVVGNSLVNASDSIDASLFVEVLKNVNSSNVAEEIGSDNGLKTRDVIVDDDFVSQHRGFHTNFENSEDLNGGDGSKFEKTVDVNASFALNKVENLEVSTTLEMTSETSPSISLEQITGTNPRISAENLLHPSSDKFEDRDTAFTPPMLVANSVSTASISLPRDSVTVKNDSSTPAKKKFRSQMPPKSIASIHEMNDILIRHRRSSRAMRPRWSSVRDQEILAARSQIGSAPIVKNHPGLYAPIFRNVSTFKKSYELMERTLKVYAYKDGQKPIFHQPELKGLYASEGWFMKLMEGNKHFLVKDPRKAHLFYIPFSSRMLEYALYVPNSHNRTNLRLYLKGYQEKIAAKYSFWNRTGGADHFLVACHDWAPYETRHHMENCIKAFCNADVTAGFKIGRDVSFPETYVRSARNPLRDLGGKPPSERRTLAFYAGNLHGYLRPILLKHWKDRDVNMKIFGPIPKADYIHHMKNSKYCICPRGYEVNSPRVVEAIFYECVPVIVSDNFVPPFFEVLDWGAFAIVLEEKDVPDLRDVLVSIPEEKYLAMQRGVRKVQRHFLWHAKPLK